MNRLIQRSLVGLLLAALTACGAGASSNTAQPPANTVHLKALYENSAQAWLSGAIDSFNQSGAKTSDGKPLVIDGTAMSSGNIVEALAQGTPDDSLVITADKLWLDMLAARRKSSGAPALALGTCATIGHSPVVMVTWRSMAEALGWPDRQFTWSDISQLALSPSAWEGYDHPEWRRLTFGHAHPLLSEAGIAAILGEAYASAPLTLDGVQSDATKSYIRVVERSVARYATDSMSMIQTMAQRGQKYLHIAIGLEDEVIANASANNDLVAIYPTETFVASYTACLLNGDSAAPFVQFLTGNAMQTAAASAGVRPLNGTLAAPFDDAHGANGSAVFKELPMPSLEVAQAIQDMWGQFKRPLNVTLVIDTSGSMQDNGKIQAARDGAQAFIKRLSDDDILTLYAFASDYSVLVSRKQVGPNRTSILDSVGGLNADGGTRLFDTVDAARSSMKTDSAHINAMIVLTDGNDTESQEKFAALRDHLQQAKGTVYLYTIGYGGDADKVSLSQIADLGGGVYYSGDPQNINQIYLDIASQVGGSRGLGR